MESERWKDVVDYEGIYEVSNRGRVRSAKGKTTHTEHHGKRKWRQRVLTQKVDSQNSCRVSLWKRKQETTWLVHRLVALAFLDNPESKKYINHKDGNRLNNFVENLEWSTSKENNNHAFDNGLMSSNQFIILENLVTGELLKFRSISKASEYLGRSRAVISTRISNGHYMIDHYVIYTTKLENIERVDYI